VAFAYLSCNGDAHAKNFSVRQLPEGEWRVTPAYDLPSIHPYGDTTMALTINGRDREEIGRTDFVALGTAVGLRPRAVERALDELCERVDLWIVSVLRTIPHRFLKIIPQWVRRREKCKVVCQASRCRGGNVGLSRLL